MINMFNLNLFKNIGVPLYLFIYLIIPYSAITQTLKVDFIRNLENALNSRDLDFIRKNFRNAGSLDSTADQRQIGMASVLLILFELVVQTNLRIQPVDVNIIINTMADNFTKDNQIRALEELLDILNIS